MRYGTWLGNGKSGGSYTGEPFRVVIHTTETTGLPGYNNGASAPHFTYQPSNRTFYQHTDTDTAARALRNLPGGVQTNRAGAIQVEIVCYSDRDKAAQSASRLWVGDLGDHHLYDIRKFLEWCFAGYDVTDTWPGRQALSYSQANAPGFRMSFDSWNAFTGVCGHQHVPENTHWDPGALDWSALVEEQDTSFAKGLTEAQWRILYRRGIARAASEDQLVDYWVSNAASRTDQEYDSASASMFVAATDHNGAHDHDGVYLKGVEGVL